MAFPDLVLNPESEYHAAVEGVPLDGDNKIKLPFKKRLFDSDKLVIDVYPLGASVTQASPVSLDDETQELVLNFTQTGNDPVRVEATVRWSASN
ncbi:MAG: hypothetical protein ACE5F6_00285 [Anaerolineae bacterium]